MKLHFLGTGAADWDISRRRDDMEWRRFSSTLIDDTLLIDPGPHIFDFAEKNKNIDYIALGHIHNAQNIKSERIRYCGTPFRSLGRYRCR